MGRYLMLPWSIFMWAVAEVSVGRVPFVAGEDATAENWRSQLPSEATDNPFAKGQVWKGDFACPATAR
jgi:hypothetical protein